MGCCSWEAGAREDCGTTVLEIDTTGATRSVAAIWGQGPGQTFVAEDTLISAITVWRRANQGTNRSDMKLWIVEVDSTGRPQDRRVVYEGPILRVMFGDGVHAVEIRYDLDPPAVLPYRGKFGFFIQHQCEYLFDLLIRDDVYAGGELWRSEIAIYHGCELRGIFDHFDEFNLACKIEYCSDATTPITSGSWGRLKVRYR
jgi:hypothetical protein